MPCYRPLDAYVIAGRTKNGKKIISFRRENNWIEKVKLPCGQCIGCRLIKSIEWATRCEHEIQDHEDNCFITLTYDDEHLPRDHSLDKSHFQKFIKRLRHHIRPIKIRYYMCGEYGDESWRPHYHALIFGYDFPDKQRIEIKDCTNATYLSDTLSKIWKYGNHHIGEANFTTAAYIARYCTKKVTGDRAEDHYHRTILDFDESTGEIKQFEEVDLLPEYSTCSTKPGIGYKWYQQYKSDCYPSNYLIRDGHKLPIPKYYDKLLERQSQAEYDQVKRDRKKQALKRKADSTPDRLRSREHCKHKQAESLLRNKL